MRCRRAEGRDTEEVEEEEAKVVSGSGEADIDCVGVG